MIAAFVASLTLYSILFSLSFKECKGRESGNPPAGVIFLREERCHRVMYLIRIRCLLARGARGCPLRPFPSVHTTMCGVLQHAFLCHDVCCSQALGLLETSVPVCSLRSMSHACSKLLSFFPQALGLLETSPFLVFCVYDRHQPLSYGC